MLFTLRVQAKRVYYECVSYRIPIDAYPIYYKHLTLIGAVSTRVTNEMTKIGYDMEGAYYMPNYASKEYFNIDYQKCKVLKKIVIVSNHVPQELEDFKTYALENTDKQIDIYGMHHTYKLVTPELLKDYDLIISVGKQYSILSQWEYQVIRMMKFAQKVILHLKITKRIFQITLLIILNIIKKQDKKYMKIL